MKRLTLLFVLLSATLPCFSQTTSVTATVTYPDSQALANANVTVTFVPSPAFPNASQYRINGSTFPQTVTATANGSGAFTLTLTDSSLITPTGSKWAFAVCPPTTSPCVGLTTPVSGSSVNLSAPLSAAANLPTNNLLFIPIFYSDTEANASANNAGIYFNFVSGLFRCYTGTTWINCGSGGGGGVSSVGLALPASLFTVSGSPVTATGTLTGAFVNNFAANDVFGNCTGSPATPGPCAITAAMVPTLNQSTTGNAATVTTSVSSTNSAFSILTAPATTGSQSPNTVASFTINPSTGAMNIPGALTVTSCTGCGSGGGGTVTSFSAGNLSPLFTSSVATPTSTPALTFSLTNASGNTLFGNATGSSGPPSYFAPSGDVSLAATSFSVNALHFGATQLSLGTAPTSGQCLSYNGTNITGAACSGGGGSGTVTASPQYDFVTYPTTGTVATVQGTAWLTGYDGVVQTPTEVTASSVQTAPVPSVAGVNIRTTACPSNADTILLTDRGGMVNWNDSAACTVTLPQAGSTGFDRNFVMLGCNLSSGTDNITPTTSTISYWTGQSYVSGAPVLAVNQGQCAWIYSSGGNYLALRYSGTVAPLTNTTAATVTNPTAATDTQLMEVPLSAGYLNTGTYKVYGSGVLNTTAASVPQVTITAKLCSVSGCGSGTVTPLAAIQSSALNTTALTNAPWLYGLSLTTVANGSTCNFIAKADPGLGIDLAATVPATADSLFLDSNTGVTAPNQNCNNALFLDFFVQQSATGASNVYKQLVGLITPLAGFSSQSSTSQFVADQVRAFDGAMASLVNQGASTGPSTQPYTINANNEVVLSIWAWNGNSSLSGVSAGGLSFQGTPAANEYMGAVYSQPVSTSNTTVVSVTGSLSPSADWITNTLALIPTGGTITARSGQISQCTASQSTAPCASSSTSIGVTKPTGEASGDFVEACIMWSTGSGNFVTPPSGFQIISATLNTTNNSELTCYAKIAGASEPASYTFLQGQTTQVTAFALAYSNVQYPDEMLTSASANFTGQTGKDICIAAIPQSCGTIGTVVNTSGGSPAGSCAAANTCVVGWGIWNTSTTASGMEYRYGTDNTTVLQNALNNLPKGGTVTLPAGGMMILGYGQANQVSFPALVPINLTGQGSASANWEQGNTNNPNAMGSELDVASTLCSSATVPAAILVAPSIGGGGNMNVLSYHLSDFTLWGGAGKNADGGGAQCGLTAGTSSSLQGLRGANVTRVLMQNLEVGNFGGDNIRMSSTTGTYGDMLTMDNVYSLFSGADGMHITSGWQNMALRNNQFDANASYGLDIGGGTQTTFWTFTMQTNTVARNTVGEMNVASGTQVNGCDIGTNYWEHDAVGSINMITNQNLLNCRWGPQTIIYGGGAGAYTASASQPTLTGVSGACTTLGTQKGGVPATSNTWWGPWPTGSVVCSGTTGTSSLTITPGPTVTNGWICDGLDVNSGAKLGQTASSTTACTIGGVSVTSGDTINFRIQPF